MRENEKERQVDIHRETVRHTQREAERGRQKETETDTEIERDREMEFDNNDHLLVIIVSQHIVIKYTCLLKVSFKFVHN